jgi:hypothetical protein
MDKVVGRIERTGARLGPATCGGAAGLHFFFVVSGSGFNRGFGRFWGGGDGGGDMWMWLSGLVSVAANS